MGDALEVKNALEWDRVYTDKGTGADQDLAVYEPILRIGSRGYYMLGHYAQNSYKEPYNPIKIVRPMKDYNAISPPSYTVWMWDDKGSGGDQDVSFWHVVCPKGYVALGDVISLGYGNPINYIRDKYACIRSDLTTTATRGGTIWTDKGSGAHHDGSLREVGCYGIGVESSYFQAQRGYRVPTHSRFRCLK